jgi:hypothetical protein
MQLLLSGFNGWLRMRDSSIAEVRLIDVGLTVVVTLLAVTTWAMLR